MIHYQEGIVHQADVPDYKAKVQRCIHCKFPLCDYSDIDADFAEGYDPVYFKGFITIFGDDGQPDDLDFVRGIASTVYCNEHKYKV